MSVDRLAGEPPSPWEERYGFSRLIRSGPFLLMAGTNAIDELGFVVGLSAYEQTVEILGKVLTIFSRAGATAENVVAIRAYVTDISRHDDVGRAFAEVFAEVRPLLTMVEVTGLIDPRMLVEIEATAYVPGDGEGSGT